MEWNALVSHKIDNFCFQIPICMQVTVNEPSVDQSSLKEESELAKAEEVMKEALTNMKKTKEEMSNQEVKAPTPNPSPPLSPVDNNSPAEPTPKVPESIIKSPATSSSTSSKKVVVRCVLFFLFISFVELFVSIPPT